MLSPQRLQNFSENLPDVSLSVWHEFPVDESLNIKEKDEHRLDCDQDARFSVSRIFEISIAATVA